MKYRSIILLFALTLVVGCRKEEVVSHSTILPTPTGNGTVEGYVGYFSPALPPPGSEVTGLPSGFTFASYHWVTGSPDCSYSMIYLVGKDSTLRRALYVRASGTWEWSTLQSGTLVYSYLNLVVDSLEVIRRR